MIRFLETTVGLPRPARTSGHPAPSGILGAPSRCLAPPAAVDRATFRDGQGSAPVIRRTRVLLVEDEALLRETTREGLEEEGFGVIAAADGEAALELMRQHGRHIDWLFTDIRLPGSLGGWHVAFEFRFLHPLRPVLYATAYADDLPPMVSGSVVLRKPYVLSEVVGALQQLDEELCRAGCRET